MNGRLAPSRAVYALGLILTAGGASLILGPFLFSGQGETVLLCWVLGGLMLVAGTGLRRARTWGWYLAFAIAVTGLVSILLQLCAGQGDSYYSLAGALVTDLVMTLVLLSVRPEAGSPWRV